MARWFQTTDVVSIASAARFNTSGWNSWSFWFRDHASSVDDINFVARSASHAAAGGVSIVGGLSAGNRTIYALLDYNGAYAGIFSTTGTFTQDVWHHALLRFYNAGTGQTNTLWANGAQDGTLASGSFTLSANVVIAGFLTGSTSINKDVDIADFAWWDTNLSDNEVIALARGMNPGRVRQANLLAHLPLWGLHSPEIDLSAYSDTATVTGTSVANGPPVTLFTPKQTSMITDTAAGQIYARTLSDSINASDGAVRGAKAFRQMPVDAISLQELIVRSQQHGRVVADAATATDAAQRTALLFHGLVDSIGVTDATQQLSNKLRQVSDNVIISDDVRRAAMMYRQLADTAAPSDSLLRFAQMYRRILDAASVTDALVVTLTLSGVTIVTRILQDNLNVADAVQRAVRMYRRESQAIDVQDGTWYSAKVVRSVTETLAVADSVARMLLLTRTVSDSVEAADAALRFALLNRVAREETDVADSFVSQITYFQQLVGFVLQSMRAEPIVMALGVAGTANVDMRREGSAAVALDNQRAQLTFARHQPILMEMRNL